jgi:hypothetical protein
MGLTNDLSDQFFTDIVDVCGRIACDPLDLLGVMMNESGVKANARNPTSNASGLIQFLPSTLAGLGYSGTPDDFRRLDADAQLPYVEAFFQPYVRYGLNSAARVYLAVFLPSALKQNPNNKTVIAQKGSLNAAIYDRNRGLDANFDGKITVGELQQAIERHYNSARWQEIAARLNAAQGGSSSDNSSGSQDTINLGTQSGIADALEALGFDRQSFNFAEAVRAFQERSGLSVDGVVGPHTRAALAAALDDAGISHTG